MQSREERAEKLKSRSSTWPLANGGTNFLTLIIDSGNDVMPLMAIGS